MRKLLYTIFILVFLSTIVKSQQIVEDIGHGVQIGLPISALVVTALKKDKKGAIQLLTSFGVETITVIGMKRIINKKRPNGGKYSFPSGHTSVAFMSSTFLWKRYGWKWGIPATALAGFVGYSRAGTDDPVHYWSDVFAGAALGILTSYLITDRMGDGVSVSVNGGVSHVGVSLRWKI